MKISLTPEIAFAKLQGEIMSYEGEKKTTKRVLAAVPDSGADYRPDPVSRTAMSLAFHIAYVEVWFLNGIAAGEFGPEKEELPPEVTKPSDLPAWYERETNAALEEVRKMTPEQAAKVIDFYGMFQMSAVMYMNFLNNHSVHHRGQLSVYLRPMGAKVPAIYGPSADEQMMTE